MPQAFQLSASLQTEELNVVFVFFFDSFMCLTHTLSESVNGIKIRLSWSPYGTDNKALGIWVFARLWVLFLIICERSNRCL